MNISLIGLISMLILLPSSNGRSHDSIATIPSNQLQGISYLSTGCIVAVGSKGLVVRSTDDGLTWDSVNSGSTRFLSSVAFLNESVGYAGGDSGTFLTTSDGGVSWSVKNLDTTLNFLDVAVQGHSVWLLSHSILARSTDDGTSWNYIPLPSLIGYDYAERMYFKDELNGWTFGLEWFRSTSDGGFTWEDRTDSVWTYYYVMSMCFSTDNKAFLGAGENAPNGYAGFILRSTDGGSGWRQTKRFDFGFGVGDIVFADSLTGWIAGGDSIRTTTDGGIHWIGQSGSWCKRLSARDKNHVIALPMFGDFPTLVTSDGGNTWLTAVEPSHSYEISKEFRLYSNFPNPFNPFTSISYALSRRAHIKLSVYNLLGQLVEVLVDERQDIGAKTVKFDAGNLSSGIYFCVLQAGSFREVRKMLLLR